MAITELTAHAATSLDAEPRAMLLAADDYSAVSGRVPLSNLYERGRSLGIGVQVSAQSWQGLGATEDERYRIAATADGGIFVMRTPYPEPLTGLAGTRRVLETAHKLIGNAWGDEGTTREQRAWVADPELVRRLQVGQACYIHAGAATFIQVARPKPSPLTLAAAPAPAFTEPPAEQAEPRHPRPGLVRAPRPGGRPTLDDFFGPGAASMAASEPFDATSDLPPADPGLTDEQVRAAWRQIAAATHPGPARRRRSVARYAAATGPSLRPVAHRVGPQRSLGRPCRPATARSAPCLPLTAPSRSLPASTAIGEFGRWTPLAGVGAAARAAIRHGRPVRLALRAAIAAALALLVLHLIPGQPAAPAVVTGLITWFLLTGAGPGAA